MGANSIFASTIDVQFGNGGTTYVGTAAAPDSGTTWNNLASGDQLNTSLVNSNDQMTTVTLTLAGSSGGFTTGILNPSHADPNEPVGTAGVYDNLLRPQVFVSGGTATITIGGLTAGHVYDLYSYEVRGNTYENTTFTVTSQAGFPSATSTPDNNTTTGLTAGEDYVHFTELTPNALGQIVETFTNGGGSVYGATNGFQLIDVTPEPSTLLALASGAIMLIPFAGRRRNGRKTLVNSVDRAKTSSRACTFPRRCPDLTPLVFSIGLRHVLWQLLVRINRLKPRQPLPAID